MTVMTDRQIDAAAASFHKHAKGCKKAPDACKECVGAIKWFKGLPLETLDRVLAERPLGYVKA